LRKWILTLQLEVWDVDGEGIEDQRAWHLPPVRELVKEALKGFSDEGRSRVMQAHDLARDGERVPIRVETIPRYNSWRKFVELA
jgi:hypothetical protein